MRTIQLSASLCDAVEREFRNRFSSLEVTLDFVLRELLRDESAILDQAEQAAVEQRLRELGYL